MKSLAKKISIFLLRLLALGASVSAIVIMVTSHDSTVVLGMEFEAKYTNSPTFKYFVLMNLIAAAYSFLTLFPFKSSRRHVILALDLIMLLLLDSSISACLALGQVGKNGNNHAGWLPICDRVPKFCNHVTGALIAGFVAAIVYVIILLNSIHDSINYFDLKI